MFNLGDEEDAKKNGDHFCFKVNPRQNSVEYYGKVKGSIYEKKATIRTTKNVYIKIKNIQGDITMYINEREVLETVDAKLVQGKFAIYAEDCRISWTSVKVD